MIEIFRKIEGAETLVTSLPDDNATLERGIMAADEVTLNVTASEMLDLRVGDYTWIEGVEYAINREPDLVKASAVEYRYDMVLESPVYNLLDKIYMQGLTGKSRFSLAGTLEDFVDLLLTNINRPDFDPGWSKALNGKGEVQIVETEVKTLTFDNTTCRDLLTKLADEFGVEYVVQGRAIAFHERVEEARDLVFEQGQGKGLYTLQRQNVDTDNTVTQAYVFGSTENLPHGYRDGQFDRLCPRERGTDVYISFFENRTEYPKLVEREVYFDDVKPSFTGCADSVSSDFLKVRCNAIDFDLKDVVVGKEGRVNFLTGDLMGIAFSFTYDHGSRTVTLIPQEDERASADSDGNRPKLPSKAWHARVGDKFTFTGITLPDAYVRDAEAVLAEKARKWMRVHSSLRVKYNLDVDYRYTRETDIELAPGDVVGIVVPGQEEVQKLRVTNVKKQLSTGKLSCEVSNYLQQSLEDSLNAKIQDVRSSIELDRSEMLYNINATREWTTRNFGRLAETMEDGEAIVWDADGWEIKTARQVPDAVLWDTHPFDDYLDQGVRTGDDVRHNSVTARAFTEEDEGHDPEVASLRLVEEGPGDLSSLGALSNVDVAADAAKENDVLVYEDGFWMPKGDVFIPTGVTPDGTEIKTFQNLLEYIAMHGGGSTPGEVQRNVRVVNDLDGKNVSASKGEPCLLKFTFVSQERYSISEPYENTGERGLCQVSVKNTNNDEFAVAREMHVASNVPLAVDVAEFLTSGSNQVMVKVTGEVTEMVTPAFVYTVYLTSLSIAADNFRWWTAFLNDIIIPLNIGGNVSKTLQVTLVGEDYNRSYRIPLGTNVYTETAYNCRLEHPGRTGVYRLSARVTNSDETITTKTMSFNVICAVPGERVKLVVVNNIQEKATNWTENSLFDYAMYDGDNITTSARFVVTKDEGTLFASDEDAISTSTRHTFSFPMEVETMDSTDFEISVSVLDGETELTGPMTFPVNNSLGFSAVAGAVFYMNPKKRSNRQGNYKDMINEVDDTVVAAAWENMNWGNDGWITDADNNKALRLMAGGKVALEYYPFKKECARTGKTIEIDYRIDHVTDYSEPVVRMSAPSGDSFVGLNIYADNIIMHSRALTNDRVQNLHTFEGKRTRLTLTIMPDAYGNAGFNLCILYINGRKNREFTYENNDYFAHDGGIVIGSKYADTDIYGIRVYDSALTSQGVSRNYINWLVSTGEKESESELNDILDANGSEIDFENTRDQYNCLVFDNTIPSMADQTQRVGTLEVFFADHPEWNVSISSVTAKGQGTSSMKYYLWNTRYQLDKNLSVITRADGTTTTKKWQMTPELIAGQKFTAKKNYASSMQSHKIGAVNSYDDLYREMGLLNEAMRTDEYANARVAVYQLPFVCFEKAINEEGQTVYTFKGLYTFGPDKGDKYTFGFDTGLFPAMISIEGSDNSPLCTLFRVPWNPASGRILYNGDEEAFQYNGANSWDLGEGDTGSISRFVPAYNIVYECSPRLQPFNGTPDELNARLADYRNEPHEFWIAKAGDEHRYDVYYYESSEGRFIPADTGSGTINLVTQLVDKGYGLTAADLTGKDDAALNTLFIHARVAKFRAEASLYWDIQDTLFFMNNVEFNAGTDERAKNTYPYSFCLDTSTFRWRVDDADTRFDTTNRGLPEKSYSVETHDTDETGAAIWNGETNNFFNLMELAFPEEKVANMRRMMVAMEALGGLKRGDDLEKIYAFYKKYFFDSAQEYFPAAAYNADAKIAYENGKLAYNAGTYSNDTDPITQSLGDHYLAEQRWVTKRILYMMSKYNFGLFSADGTDTITVRAAGNSIRYELTPGMDMYPAIANGTSIIRGNRTKAGEVCTMDIELSGTGDQQNAIMGASYLLDIGDWYNKNVSGSMIIQGRMLRTIRLGSKTEPIVISIGSLTLSNCVSLQKLVLSRIATLAGTLNLSSCTHLQEVYADGTSLTQVVLPKGGGLRVVEFSAYNRYLSLSNYPLLTTEGVGIDSCKSAITDFFVVDCPLLKPMQLLVDIMDAQSGQGNDHALKRIRAVGFEETYYSSGMLDKLAKMADGSYEGLSSDGIAGEDPLPVLDGTLNIYADVYEDSINALRNSFSRLVLNIKGNYYVRFKDPEFQRLVVAKWSTDGVGVTQAQLDKVTVFPYGVCNENTIIEDLSDFGEKFPNVVEIEGSAFEYCTGLTSIGVPVNKHITIKKNAFIGTSLNERGIDLLWISVGDRAFCYCKFVNLFIPNTVNFDSGTNHWASNNLLVRAELEEGHSLIPQDICTNCTSLKTFVIPSTVNTIRQSILHGCNAIKYIICKAITPPRLDNNLGYINQNNWRIYVPDESVDVYKVAANWSTLASKIKPISEYVE